MPVPIGWLQANCLEALGAGFGLMAGLIVAVGAQNAFLLRQGLAKRHVGLLVLICIACDAVLIVAGSLGFGAVVHGNLSLFCAVSWGGAAFLVVYGVLALKRAIWPGRMEAGGGVELSAWAATRTVLAVTLLNPHVYIDTVVLVGGLAGRYEDAARAFYILGAIAASVCWFTMLGFGARLLAPVFATTRAWRILDGLIAAVMFAIAIGLVQTALS